MGQTPVSGWSEDPTRGPTLARLRRISESSGTSSGEELPDVTGGGRLRAWVRVGRDWVPGVRPRREGLSPGRVVDWPGRARDLAIGRGALCYVILWQVG